MTHEPLAAGPLGMRLLAFEPAERAPEGSTFPDHDVAYALVALRHTGRLLLVRVRGRDCWELPGGGIEPGETARAAAVRELHEEGGQTLPPEALRFAGYARTALPNRTTRYGAVYTAEIAEPAPFTPNEEIAAACWWDGGAPPGGGTLQTVDTYLAALVR